MLTARKKDDEKSRFRCKLVKSLIDKIPNPKRDPVENCAAENRLIVRWKLSQKYGSNPRIIACALEKILKIHGVRWPRYNQVNFISKENTAV